MAQSKKQLVLKIEQAGKIFYQKLSKRGGISIGRHPDNDITVYGENFPRKHILFSQKNHHIQLNLKQDMQGEVLAGESRLSFKDLFLHNLLPKKGDNFCYPLTQNKRGYVIVGDARISFQFVDESPRQAAYPEIQKFNGYSWVYATFKELGRDLPFKAILILMIVLHVFLFKYMSQFSTDIIAHKSTADVPERLVKFIVKSPASATSKTSSAAVRSEAEEAESDAEKSEEKPGKRKSAPVENQGVLGLLTGKGGSGKSNLLAEFLLDKGLVQELDAVMSGSDLKLGKGSGEGFGDDLDNLFSASEGEGGIDDILGDLNDVETVSLGKKGQIQVDKIGGMTGSQAALGKRTEESVRAVILRNQGRLTYIYNKYLKSDQNLSGKMVVEVEIAANGRVSEVRLVSSGMNNPEFEQEILSFVRKWQFEPIEQGTVTVTYPLVFHKVG